MRNPGTIRATLAAVLLAAIGLVGAPPTVMASGVTAEALVERAQSGYDMQCASFEDAWSCGLWPLSVSFSPATGPVSQLLVRSDQYADVGMSEGGNAMFLDFLGAACADQAGVAQFVHEVGGLTGEGQLGRSALGDCVLQGGYAPFNCEFGCYYVGAVVQAPSPTPEPTREPTPRPARTAGPSVVTPAAVTPSPSMTPRATALTTSPASEPSTTPTPEQDVLGGNPSPTPSQAEAAAPLGSAAPAILAGAIVRSVPAASGISTQLGTLAGSALLVLVLVLFVAFAGELFNSTLESNYDEVAGWLAFAGPALGRLAGIWRGPIGIVAFLAAGALVYALLDPGLAPDAAAAATYLGLLLGLVIILISFELPGLLLYRRRTGELPVIRALPWTLPAAVACVALSRVADLQPAYLYGILLGLVFRRELTVADEGRQTAAGAAWTLLVAVSAWAGLEAMRSGGAATEGFGPVVAQTALSVIVVGGLEAVALGLLPMRFLAGAAVYAWSRAAWALLLAAGAFAFIHLLVGPKAGYLAELDPAAFVVACGAFAAFGAVSIAFWAYFRFRPSRAPA